MKRKEPETAAAAASAASAFTATAASAATSPLSCAKLPNNVLMPWIGFGTYKLGEKEAKAATLQALQHGYRAIDTAFIYAGEKTEKQVGLALAASKLARDDVFITTKHWRKYHGYEPAKKCLALSLSRLGVTHVDLWLMHWPGPAWSTMNRRKDLIEAHGRWHYAAEGMDEGAMPALRAETWRAMEDALAEGKARSIGVSNFTVAHLETLKKTARVWPPAVNQVELHPYHSQAALRAYCAKEGIVVQAYASLGGQDAGKATLAALGGPLLAHPAVLGAAAAHGTSAAQVLLRWALQKGCAVVPKTTSKARLVENLAVGGFALSDAEVAALDALDQAESGRLCWRSDPLRMMDFE